MAFNTGLATWAETAVGTNGGATATHAGAASGSGLRHIGIAVQASGDAAGVVTVESPAGTVLYKKRYAGAFTLSEPFPYGAIKGTVEGAMVAKVSASTSNSEVNIQGYTE
jgi:hypothetical protein